MNLRSIITKTLTKSPLAERVTDHIRLLVEEHRISGDIHRFKYDRPSRPSKDGGDDTPNVFVLGRWRQPNTHNNLACGINLNYMSGADVIELRKMLPRILAHDTVKDKYWAGIKLLPDIFKRYYRTYDEKFIHAVTKDQLFAWDEYMSRMEKDRDAHYRPALKVARDRRTKAQRAEYERSEVIRKREAALGREPEVELEFEPDEGAVTPPVTGPEAVAAAADVAPEVAEKAQQQLADIPQEISKMEKLKEPKMPELQAREQDLEDESKKLEAERIRRKSESLLKRLRGEQEEAELKFDDETENESRLRGLNAIIDAYAVAHNKPPSINWRSHNDYIKWHGLNEFFNVHPSTNKPVIESAHGNRFLAVYDVIDDKLIVDVANSHVQMLSEAGWDYNHTVCLSIDSGKVNAFYDHPRGKKALDGLMDGEFGRLVSFLD